MTQVHEQLFTSGAYVREFRPDDRDNPFARAYAAKREAVLALVPPRARRLLDVGGGPGRMAIPLGQHHEVMLCDLSRGMLATARSQPGGLRLRLAAADARSLPFADRTFDCALCIDVLPHLPDPAPALAEARRVLRPGGTLIVDSTNSVPLWTLAYPGYLGRRPTRWWRIWRSGGVLPEWTTRVWHRRRGAFLASLLAAGFEIRQVRHFGPAACPKWHLAMAVAP